MAIEKRLDDILDTKSKVKIIRLFVSRTENFMASGREIAKLIGLTPPAAHTALKELYNQDILKREIIGRQHIYKINHLNRMVKDILQPAFQKELSTKEDISDYLRKKIKSYKIQHLIASLILYGSIARGQTHGESDCDIAVVVKNASSKKEIESVFMNKISSEFSDYFSIHLHPYIKTYNEFMRRFKKRLSPLPKLMESYTIVYGKDPVEYK